jgi:hypothetical protein
MVIVAAARAIVGTGLQRSQNVASVSRTGVGTYTLALAKAAYSPTLLSGVVTPPPSDGVVVASISGPFHIDADFVDAMHIAIAIIDPMGAASDPPNGTRIRLVAMQ